MSDHSELKRLAEAATPQDFDSAQVSTHDGWIECPACGGEGSVDLGGDYLNYDNEALGVQFYGIGDTHVNAEAYYRAANPAAVLELIAEIEALRKDAERYRWLRDDSIDPGAVIDKKVGVSSGGYPIWEYRSGDDLDSAIDSAMSKGDQP